MIYERIKSLCEEKEVSVYRVERDLSFPNATIAKWKDSIPGADRLKKVADYFGVPIEYFLEE